MNINRIRTLAALTVAVVATAVVQVATAGTALAVPDLEFEVGQSAQDSVATKSATATCDEGQRILGGGGFITGGGRQVQFTRLQPNGSSDTYVVTATEIGNYAGNWRVSAYGICGEAPAGLEYKSFHSFTNSDELKTGAAQCSAGKKVLGTGARTEGGDGQVIIEDIYVPENLLYVSATVVEDSTGYSGNWSMWSYAVCANPVAGQERVEAPTVSDSNDKAVGVPCGGAKKVHGVGGRINGGDGEVMHGGIYPAPDLGSATLISLEEANGQADNWNSEVFAVCAN
jgi:hypothetical protein